MKKLLLILFSIFLVFACLERKTEIESNEQDSKEIIQVSKVIDTIYPDGAHYVGELKDNKKTGQGKQTYVPDDNFEQELINLGYDNVLDDYVQTSNINTVTNLNVNSQNIADLTGIEDFTALTHLYCYDNQLTSLDVSQNTALTDLHCWSNQLTSLDVSNNTALTNLGCQDNQLTSLDLRNGNNTYFVYFYCKDNLLYCIDVDDAYWSATNWACCYDPQIFFSEDCGVE